MSEFLRQKILEHVRQHCPVEPVIMEIGVAGGDTTMALAEVSSGAKVYCCDPFVRYPDKPQRDEETTYLEFRERIQPHVDEGRIIFSRETSESFLTSLRREERTNFFDFVYIDGNHFASHVASDFFYSFPLVKVNGLIAFDDYSWTRRGAPGYPHESPKIAIDFILALEDRVELLDIYEEQLVILKKISNG